MPQYSAAFTLTLSAQPGGEDIIYQYTNGQVSSLAINNSASFALIHLEENIQLVRRWIETILRLESLTPIPLDGVKINEDLKIDTTSVDLDVRVHTADMHKLSLSYNRATHMITASSRPSFTVDWAHFYYEWTVTLPQYLVLIKTWCLGT